MPKVDVSFKKTSRDMKLYLEVISKEEKSDFVKQAIEHYIKFLDNSQKEKVQRNS
ncbi:hypothetical protein [Clostridium botulinum]|uniref:hypothetical protein n=1 Tax=Clostridium botulinum TaxID=1491 RepID=UPI00249F0A7B|nr:hypothetical protein [Clostridium botulinum]MDU4596419.1 hypothetical protein [Clostridium sporogenes]WGZ48058.1 hypothetical protein HEQ52_18080 [Clostridium botulinum]